MTFIKILIIRQKLEILIKLREHFQIQVLIFYHINVQFTIYLLRTEFFIQKLRLLLKKVLVFNDVKG
jgi:hypothetical protein